MPTNFYEAIATLQAATEQLDRTYYSLKDLGAENLSCRQEFREVKIVHLVLDAQGLLDRLTEHVATLHPDQAENRTLHERSAL